MEVDKPGQSPCVCAIRGKSLVDSKQVYQAWVHFYLDMQVVYPGKLGSESFKSPTQQNV